ncbi:MAG: hypothetical protein ABJZ55_12860 [Fuerstiella sp.]
MNTSRKLLVAFACLPLCVPSIAINADDQKAAPAEAAKPIVMKLKTLTLTVPATWNESDIQSRMRLTTLDIPAASKDGAKGELAIFNFTGGGGGLKQNIERWIGQFGAEGRESKVVKGKAGNEEYHLLELSGTYNKSVGPPIMRKTEAVKGYRMLGAIVTVDSEVYYLKMTGPDAAIKAAAKDFRKSFGGSSKSEELVEL